MSATDDRAEGGAAPGGASVDANPTAASGATGASATDGKREWVARARLIGIIVIAALFIVIVFQNSQPVALELLFFRTAELPLWLVLTLHFLGGAGAGMLFLHLWRRRRTREDRGTTPGR